jgi:hypothetical protein
MTAPRKRHRAEPAADRGADGPAMLARPSFLTVIEDDTAADDGSPRFTRSEVRRINDTVLGWYAERGILTGGRYDAAVELARLYHQGNNAPTRYRVSSVRGGGEMSDERAEAWGLYCRALDHLPKRCESACADIARGMWPTGLNAVANMQEGFDVLAQMWRMK